MLKIGVIQFNDQKLDVYGTAKRPCFIAADVAKVIDYSDGNTGEMLSCLEKDEFAKVAMVRGGQRRSVWVISELGLYNLLGQSRKPIARMWRRVVHQQLVTARIAKGITVEEQFDEWDALLDSIYIDPKTGIMMQSVTVAGGDVEQVPYED